MNDKTPGQEWLDEMADIQAGMRLAADDVRRLHRGLLYVLNDYASEEVRGIAESLEELSQRLGKSTNAKVHADYVAQCESTGNVLSAALSATLNRGGGDADPT